MAAPKRGPRLGSGPAHQKQLLANLASDLFRHGRIRTTETKAKTLRPYAEKLITKAKAGDLHARRQVLSKLHDRDVVAYLFDDVAPRFTDRNGGYTRVLKLGPRRGDNAPMALIELVEQGAERGEDVIEESKQGRMRGLFGRRRRPREEPSAPSAFADDEADIDEAPEDEVHGDEVAGDEVAVDEAPDDEVPDEPAESSHALESDEEPEAPDEAAENEQR